MKLNFLGKGSAFYPVYGNTGAYMMHENDLYLLDCGTAAFDVLYKRLDLDKLEQVYVIMTHLHADHVGSLGTLISYFYCVRKKLVSVIHPDRTVTELLRLEGIEDDFYTYFERLPENRAGLFAEPVEVNHAENMKCYGYLLTAGKEQIYYSGDASDIPEHVLETFLQEKINRIYQDTSTHNADHPSHCYYGKLEKLIPPDKRGQVYCMHLDSPCDDLLIKKGFRIVEVEGEQNEL